MKDYCFKRRRVCLGLGLGLMSYGFWDLEMRLLNIVFGSEGVCQVWCGVQLVRDTIIYYDQTVFTFTMNKYK
jgi:hypothetical protein